MPDSLLTIRDARKSFGTTAALQGASLTLEPGELLGLLGPNGAGKTTLVRAVAGRVRLDGGSMELLGRPLQPESPRPELGVVPQEIAVYPLLTARENLEVFGRLQGLRGQALAERVAWALAWTALDARAAEPVKRFSGGMRRRLAAPGARRRGRERGEPRARARSSASLRCGSSHPPVRAARRRASPSSPSTPRAPRRWSRTATLRPRS